MVKTAFAALLLITLTFHVQADEYPTEETVRFALNCMSNLGGQTDENLYTCICRYDNIRDVMNYSDYEEGLTYERNKSMPGKKGGFFRENKRAEAFYETLINARQSAIAACPVVKKVKLDRTVSR